MKPTTGHVCLRRIFTDLVDSTALKTARGDQAVRDLIRRHREHVTRLSGDSSGRIIDWAGDGCFLIFDTSCETAAILNWIVRMVRAEPVGFA